MDLPEKMADIIAPHRERGFRAFKIGWGPFGRRDDPRLDEAIVRAAREAAGAQGKLFVDAGASDAYWPQGLKWALRTAEMLGTYDVGWFEEALPPDDIEGSIELRRRSPIPIARRRGADDGGRAFSRGSPVVLWTSCSLHVTKVGGLSEQRRIAWLATDFGVAYVGHGWNTALGPRRRSATCRGDARCPPRRVHRR